MARINDVRLYGIVAKPPTIHKDEKTGEYLKGFCTIIVVARYPTASGRPPKFAYPRILSRNPDRIEEMSRWKTNDIVEIKGSLTTKNMTKAKVCANCGEKIKQPGTVVYVHPIFSEVRKSNLTQEEALKEINTNAEISNSVVLMGVLCSEPKAYVNNKNGVRLTTYQLAVKRRFRIAEDPAETDVDFPWVKSYREQSVEDIKSLRKGSVVLIDGKLQVRERDVKSECPKCHAEVPGKDYSMEVVPHAVEYLRNYYTPEEIHQREAESLEKVKAEVFSNENEIILQATRPEDYVDEKSEAIPQSEKENIQALVNKIFES